MPEDASEPERELMRGPDLGGEAGCGFQPGRLINNVSCSMMLLASFSETPPLVRIQSDQDSYIGYCEPHPCSLFRTDPRWTIPDNILKDFGGKKQEWASFEGTQKGN